MGQMFFGAFLFQLAAMRRLTGCIKDLTGTVHSVWAALAIAIAAVKT